MQRFCAECWYKLRWIKAISLKILTGSQGNTTHNLNLTEKKQNERERGRSAWGGEEEDSPSPVPPPYKSKRNSQWA